MRQGFEVRGLGRLANIPGIIPNIIMGTLYETKDFAFIIKILKSTKTYLAANVPTEKKSYDTTTNESYTKSLKKIYLQQLESKDKQRKSSVKRRNNFGAIRDIQTKIETTYYIT